jgi:hypothetical protein
MPEISDADFELLKLSKSVLGGKNRLQQLRLMKEASPDRVIPELDTEDRIHSALTPIQEENKKLREDLDRREALDGLKEKRRGLKDKFAFTEQDVTAVEKLMVEKGIANHDTAAEFYKANQRVATPSVPSFDRSARVPQNEGLAKDPAQWAREEAAKVAAEFATQR